MKKIYLDNACTSFPKPEAVPAAMYKYMTEAGSNINRSSYSIAYDTEELVYETRQLLCRLFNASDSKNVIFTSNITESLNIILKGFLKSGDHCLVSSMEHNAVMRPLSQLTESGVTFTRIPCNTSGVLDVNKLECFLTPQTKAVVMLHASNVCGTLLPIAAAGSFCKMHGLRFIVDTAQTAGVCPIDMKKMNIDALAFTGHKGLLGPQGIGGFILGDDMPLLLDPLISGGTGSVSHAETIPDFMPDRFEAGTLNIPGILGLREGLLWIDSTGIDNIFSHEMALTEHFLKGLLELEAKGKIIIIGKKDTKGRTGVISIQTVGTELSQAAYELDEKYGIMSRVGLHCAPSAHKTLGTFPEGTLRFSVGWWNETEDIDFTLEALREML